MKNNSQSKSNNNLTSRSALRFSGKKCEMKGMKTTNRRRAIATSLGLMRFVWAKHQPKEQQISSLLKTTRTLIEYSSARSLTKMVNSWSEVEATGPNLLTQNLCTKSGQSSTRISLQSQLHTRLSCRPIQTTSLSSNLKAMAMASNSSL